ncbi:MAG: prepilin peptidase [Lachnospiraceae bacterium]|nr:prepilin peptidase [Lachnospiraceae bacterium]
MPTPFFLYPIIFLYGIVIGSFLNVVILRVPVRESIVSKRSHCTSCSHVLHWYDLFPLFSYLFLRGRCRYCGAKISPQYPIVEAANGVLWMLMFVFCGMSWDTVLMCFVASALLCLSVIDARTQEIPLGINIFIAVCGVARVCLHYGDWLNYLIGAVSVSWLLLIIFYASGGRAMGGGDVKLMAAAGLFLGWKLVILSFMFGCLYGSVIHIARMKISKKDHVLAMGPYLSAGILTAMWFGEYVINWYISLF